MPLRSSGGLGSNRDFILPLQSRADKGKKTLILDLDETLVHSSFQPDKSVDIVVPVFPNKSILLK